MALTIDELLAALKNPSKASTLPNTADTWRRIGAKDSFSELNLGSSELTKFLTDWAAENPYNNI